MKKIYKGNKNSSLRGHTGSPQTAAPPPNPPPPHGRRWEGQVPAGAGSAWTLLTFLRPS